mmetsp:Transcript_52191/g.163920  ORF Transcript_52191/g.163920 Transcript_52191/m.163920 type:complete len:265 (+) Transcript_52191:562-1356(+)
MKGWPGSWRRSSRKRSGLRALPAHLRRARAATGALGRRRTSGLPGSWLLRRVRACRRRRRRRPPARLVARRPSPQSCRRPRREARRTWTEPRRVPTPAEAGGGRRRRRSGRRRTPGAGTPLLAVPQMAGASTLAGPAAASPTAIMRLPAKVPALPMAASRPTLEPSAAEAGAGRTVVDPPFLPPLPAARRSLAPLAEEVVVISQQAASRQLRLLAAAMPPASPQSPTVRQCPPAPLPVALRAQTSGPSGMPPGWRHPLQPLPAP